MTPIRPLRGALRVIRSLVSKNTIERELNSELAFHVDKETEKNVRAGMSPADARRKALLAFGPMEATKEQYRDGRGTRWIEEFGADIRFALRTLRRSPALAAAAIITLALGVGANTAVFSAVNAVILRPLPFAEPDRLVMLWESNVERGWVNETAAPANILDWKEQVRAFEDVGGYASFSNSATLTGHGEPRQITSVQVTGNFFRVLGVRPAAGSLFRDDETFATGELNGIISHALWREVFSSDPGIVGKTVSINEREMRVVGVLPREFEIPGVSADLWRPTAFQPAQRTQVSFRRAHWIRPIARLRDGVSPEQANAEFQVVIARLQQDYPVTNTNMNGGFTPLHQFLTGESRRPLFVLLGAVALLLLIACANVGNLLLVHAASREREVSVRLALGAKRSRLVRQAITESLVLSALGGAAGLALGWWSTQLLSALRPPGLLPAREIAMSWPVLAYVVAISALSGLLFGIAPALGNRRRAPADVLREGARGASGGVRARRWSEALLVGEVAIALLLTSSAGLLVKSLWNLQHVDAGADTRGVLTTTLTLPGIRYDSVSKVQTFWDQLEERLRTSPGVNSSAVVSKLALLGPSWSSDFTAAGWPEDKYGVDVLHREISPGYTDAMRVPLLLGRVFDHTDAYGGERVVVINEVFAQRYFPSENPVGRRITFSRVADTASIWRTVVGVIGSERQTNLATEPRPEVFEPAAQRVLTSGTLVVRSDGDPTSMLPVLRQAVAALDPNLALAEVRTMDAVRSESAARQRFLTILLAAFAAIGVALAVVGVYGVMAQVARRRTREMGIRIALGAQAPALQWLVVQRGLALTVTGVAIGLVAALATTGLLRALLFNVEPLDPWTLGMVPVLLTVAGLAATWLPAMRASRSDPIQSLRQGD